MENKKTFEQQELDERTISTNRLFFETYKAKQPVASAPTAIPKNFYEQFQIYENGATKRLYIYVGTTWRYVALT